MTVKTEHSFLREGKTAWLSPCIDDCEMTVQVLFIFSFRSSWGNSAPLNFPLMKSLLGAQKRFSKWSILERYTSDLDNIELCFQSLIERLG